MKAKDAVAYLRVSGKGQIRGTGFARQKETVELYAQNNGYRIPAWYRESHTGTDADRPVFAEMLEDLLSNGVRTVVIESMDRLARDLVVQHQLIALLIRKDVTLISATTGQNITENMAGDPMLKALVQIQGVFAELEKSLLVRKLRKARNRTKADKGRCEGRKPFGYRPGESETVQRIKQLYRKPRNEPRLGFYQIATILNREGYSTRTGKPWHGSTVRQVVQREVTTAR